MTAESDNTGELSILRKRLRYRAWHRGTLEMDQVLGNFADAHLDGYDRAALERFERLLEEYDGDLLAWITGQLPVPESADGELIAEVTAFQKARASQ